MQRRLGATLFFVLMTLCVSHAQATVARYQATGTGDHQFGDTQFNGGIQTGGAVFVGDPFTADFSINSQATFTSYDSDVAYVGYVYDLPVSDAPNITVAGSPLSSFNYNSASAFQIEIIPSFSFSPGSEVLLSATYPDIVGTGYLTVNFNLLSSQSLPDGNLSDLTSLSSPIFTPQDTFSISSVPEPASIGLVCIAGLTMVRARRRV